MPARSGAGGPVILSIVLTFLWVPCKRPQSHVRAYFLCEGVHSFRTARTSFRFLDGTAAVDSGAGFTWPLIWEVHLAEASSKIHANAELVLFSANVCCAD